jgi:hypothetical protein
MKVNFETIKRRCLKDVNQSSFDTESSRSSELSRALANSSMSLASSGSFGSITAMRCSLQVFSGSPGAISAPGRCVREMAALPITKRGKNNGK